MLVINTKIIIHAKEDDVANYPKKVLKSCLFIVWSKIKYIECIWLKTNKQQ